MPNILSAPIPGQSLTMAPGASKMEYPAKFTDVDEALEFVETKLMKPKTLTKMLMLMEKGIPAESIGRTLLASGLVEGLWNTDLMLLMAPLVVTMLASIARAKGVDAKFRNEDPEYKKFMSRFVDITPKEVASSPSNIVDETMSVLKGF